MATTALSSLLPLVVLPRCPRNSQLQALRLALRQFCMDTEVWREAMSDLSAVEDQEDYTLSPEYDDVTIHRVVSVELDDTELPESRWGYSPDGTLTIDPAPVADGTIAVTVAYLPDPACSAAVDWLMARWGDAIAAKAMCDMKLDPQSARDPVPWYDPNGAMLWMERYRDRVAEAKLSLLVGGRSGEISVLHSPFYL